MGLGVGTVKTWVLLRCLKQSGEVIADTLKQDNLTKCANAKGSLFCEVLSFDQLSVLKEFRETVSRFIRVTD